MNNEQKEVIQDIYNTLEAVAYNTSMEYIHNWVDGKKELIENVNREEHLQAIIEWALQQIENNFDFYNDTEVEEL
ncbi:type II toxin-antitoxin system antitoxin TscA [Staphylococcus aureus]|uniref:type II toxin-antitoxin system antitoxin TscA n=1 Tax=Staphylococcus aureus TaxID=1280 RepID=UPI003F5C38D5